MVRRIEGVVIMTDQERLQMKGMLAVVTGWSEDLINKFSDGELKKHYSERVINR